MGTYITFAPPSRGLAAAGSKRNNSIENLQQDSCRVVRR
jgi:hypothetical protein